MYATTNGRRPTAGAAATYSRFLRASCLAILGGTGLLAGATVSAADCEVLYAVGAGDLIVGRGEYCDYPAEVLAVPAVSETMVNNAWVAMQEDWVKATFGFSLPVMANVAEIVRGAVRSVPNTQWEAAESLAFTRRQTMWRIILPQCA